MYLVSSSTGRIKEERVRCGLSVPQAAALSNVSVELWEALEAGLICPGMDFTRSLLGLGFDPMYIGIGERSDRNKLLCEDFVPSEATSEGHAAADQRERIEQLIANQASARTINVDPYAQAVALLRRSSAAVDAFVGQ